MELRQLRYLVAVVDTGGFTRASEHLHVAQPGVSAQVRRLERELGQELLDRSGRRVRPTAVGAAVLPHARAALHAVAAVRHSVEQHTGLLRGEVAVGAVAGSAAALVDLPGLLAAFHDAHPGVRVTLTEARADQLVRALREGELDLGLVALPSGPVPEGIAAHVVADEPLVLAVAPGDPLAGRARVAAGALRERDLVSTPRGTALRATLEAACARAGFSPRVACEASDPPMLAELAARGLGVALVPASVVAARPGRLRAVPVAGPQLRGRLALAWRPEGPGSPAAQALVAHARAAVA